MNALKNKWKTILQPYLFVAGVLLAVYGFHKLEEQKEGMMLGSSTLVASFLSDKRTKLDSTKDDGAAVEECLFNCRHCGIENKIAQN